MTDKINRFHQAALSIEELEQLTDKLAPAAKLLKVDEIKINHDKRTAVFGMPESIMSMRLGTRWMSTGIAWSVIEDAREGKFHAMSHLALDLARHLHQLATKPEPSQFTAVIAEVEEELKKP